MIITGRHSPNSSGFAGNYLSRYSTGREWDLPQPDPELLLTVIIPSYREPDLSIPLNSLLTCRPPGIRWEILVVINFPEGSSAEVINVSHQGKNQVEAIAGSLNRNDVRVHALWCPDLPAKQAGVGLARKIGMDAAVSRFNLLNRPEGILVSFDADATCEAGYLSEIVTFFATHRVRTANIFFEHPLDGPLNPHWYRIIAEYELYLRFVRLAFEQAGHPHAIHTVGSSFCVRAETYVRVNGMGNHQAGEDFYFLHKCVRQGQFYELNSTTVYPSSRSSDRVIFGTGATVMKQAGLDAMLPVYSWESFGWLTLFLGSLDELYRNMTAGSGPWEFPQPMDSATRSFLDRMQIQGKMIRLFNQTASFTTFRTRFFAWFDALMVLRYLNDLHSGPFLKQPVLEEASKLARLVGLRTASNCREMLLNYRQFERQRGIRKVT